MWQGWLLAREPANCGVGLSVAAAPGQVGKPFACGKWARQYHAATTENNRRAMTSPFDSLTDAELDFFRREKKDKLSGPRLKPKHVYLEQQFELGAVLNSDRRYRLYRRHHPGNTVIFSVGLAVCIEGEWLTICRYNGPYHAHRNQIERNKFDGVCHIHTATQRYIAQGRHADAFAEETDRYSGVDGAWRCILIDCNISGILPSGDADPDSQELDFQ